LEELESRSFPGSAMALLALLSDWSQDDRTQAIPPTSASVQDISKQSYVQKSASIQDSPGATLPTRADAAVPASLQADRARGDLGSSTSTQGFAMPPDRPAPAPMAAWPWASLPPRAASRSVNTMPAGVAARAPRPDPPEPEPSHNAPAPQAAGDRPIDETGNNRANPNWGRAGTDLLRVTDG
jgi:hypothetical protein